MTIAQKKSDAIRELKEIGAELAKREDRFGETRTGWWQDGVWVAPANDPIGALNSIKFGS